jgi:transcriptional regulator with XRE-family HTH domain
MNMKSDQSNSYSFHDYLHKARLKSGKTLKQVAAILEKKNSYLSELERGLRPTPHDDAFILKLENLLETPKGELLCMARLSRDDIEDRLIKLLKNDVELALDYYRTIYTADDNDLLAAIKNFIETLKRSSNWKFTFE